MTTKSTGLTTIPKLKYEHVYLTNFSKMRVDLATQVSNETHAEFIMHKCTKLLRSPGTQ